MDAIARNNRPLLAHVRELLRQKRISEATQAVSTAIETACDDDDLAAALKAKNRVMRHTDTLTSCANYWGNEVRRQSVIDDAFRLSYSYLLRAVCLMEHEAYIEAAEVLKCAALHAPNCNKRLKNFLQNLLVDALILGSLHEDAVLELANQEHGTLELRAYIERADTNEDGLALYFYVSAMKHLEEGNDAECEADLLASLSHKPRQVTEQESEWHDSASDDDEPAASAEAALIDMVSYHFDRGDKEHAHNLIERILLSNDASHSLKAESLLIKSERSNNDETAARELTQAIHFQDADSYILFEILMLRCCVYKRKNDWSSVFSDADKAIRIYLYKDSFLAHAHLERGLLRRIKESTRPQFKRAIDDFTKAIEMPGCEIETALDAHFWRAETHHEAGNTKNAVADYSFVIQKASVVDAWTLNESRLARAGIYTKWRKAKEAIDDLSAVIEDTRAVSEQKFKAWLERAYLYANCGDVKSAERDIDRLLVRCADDDTIRRALWLRNDMLRSSESYARTKERRQAWQQKTL